MKRLPQAEFEVMKAVWGSGGVVTSTRIMELLNGQKSWKVQTVITLLGRLVERGFLSTEKQGKERTYLPLVRKEDYLSFETSLFLKQYHGDSFASFVGALFDHKNIEEKDVTELLDWMNRHKE